MFQGLRDHSFWARMTKEEKDWLIEMAEKEGLSQSQYVRLLLKRAWIEYQAKKEKKRKKKAVRDAT